MEQALLTSTSSKSRLKRSHKKKTSKNPSWKLRLTLKRDCGFRFFEERDVAHAWASYKTGGSNPFDLEEGLDPQAFKDLFMERVSVHFNTGWTLLQEGKPVGMIFCRDVGQTVFLETVLWFPETSLRTKLEVVVNLIRQVGRKRNLTYYADADMKGFCVVVCAHGVARRVGHKHGIFEGPAFEFESVDIDRDRVIH